MLLSLLLTLAQVWLQLMAQLCSLADVARSSALGLHAFFALELIGTKLVMVKPKGMLLNLTILGSLLLAEQGFIGIEQEMAKPLSQLEAQKLAILGSLEHAALEFTRTRQGMVKPRGELVAQNSILYYYLTFVLL